MKHEIVDGAIKISDVLAVLKDIHDKYGDLEMIMKFDGKICLVRCLGVLTNGEKLGCLVSPSPETKCPGCARCRNGTIH